MNLEQMRVLLKGVNRLIDVKDYLTLYHWVEMTQPTVIVEAGTYFGVSGMVMLKAAPKAKLITIDNLSDGSIKNEENWGKYLPLGAIKIKGEATKAMPRVLEAYKPDLVFLDDGHSYHIVSTNLRQCKEAGVKYAIVHDVRMPGIRRAVLEMDPHADIMEGNKGIALLRLGES